MKRALVELLRSPRDGSPLRLETAESGEEVLEGALVDAAGARFELREGVPHLLPDGTSAPDEGDTFEFKWRRIGGSYGVEEKSRERRRQWYLDRFGFGTHERLLEFLDAKRLVLDAGSGSGVDTAVFGESRATVVAADLSAHAALATYKNAGGRPNVHVVRADLTRLPFPAATFDYVSCDQVLHHTPNTASSFTALARHVKPGGHLAVYVYRKKGPIREFSDDFIREGAVRMPAQECYDLCVALTQLGKALSELKTEVEVPMDIPLLGVKAGPIDVQRFIYWNVLKCFWNAEYDFTTNVMINFDWYHPRYAFRHTPEEVRGWFEAHGFRVERFDVIESGISAVGRLG